MSLKQQARWLWCNAPLILIVCLPWLTGCQGPALLGDLAIVPLGIYSVTSTNDLTAVKAAGFNLVTGPASRSYLDAAHQHGLQVLASPNTSAGPGFDPPSARQAIRQFDRHPALWAWYLVDEPDLNQISPDQVRHAERFVKSLAPAKPTALVIYQGYEVRNYGNIADILMLDRYPIPWLPLANFGQHVQMARLALPPTKPLIAVIQAFDWSCFPELVPGERNLRPPTEAELRCMTYEALAHGANGLFYFAYDAGCWKMREHPETWDALTHVVAEVNARRPLFQAEPIWWAKSHAFGDPAHRFNAALESSITSCLLRVRKGNAAIPAGDYVLAVNNTEWTQSYSFSKPERRTKTASKKQKTGKGREAEREEEWEKKPGPGRKKVSQKVTKETKTASAEGEKRFSHEETDLEVPIVGENRVVEVRMGRIMDEFGPYAVHVYGPLR